jgi:hypothetical protein
MWLFTAFGFFSIVQKKPADAFLTVRARVAADLDRFRQRVPQLSPTITGGGTDYPFRATIAHAEFALALANIARDINYPNFKDEIEKKLGTPRERQLERVWHAMKGTAVG